MDANLKLRVQRELRLLSEGGCEAVLVEEPVACVVYKALATGGDPASTDVAVKIPDGYPASAMDLAALPSGSPLQGRVAGGTNPQGTFSALGSDWTLSSYHPHQWPDNAWDPNRHGFHTYLTHLISWLKRLN